MFAIVSALGARPRQLGGFIWTETAFVTVGGRRARRGRRKRADLDARQAAHRGLRSAADIAGDPLDIPRRVRDRLYPRCGRGERERPSKPQARRARGRARPVKQDPGEYTRRVAAEQSRPHPRAARAQALRASPPMFRSRTLDRLTRVHPVVPALVFAPASRTARDPCAARRPRRRGARGVRVGLGPVDAHRVLGPSHGVPLRARGGPRRAPALDDPRSPPRPPERSMRLVMPPVLSIPIGAAFLGLFVWCSDRPGWAVCAGFYSGYLVYDTLHFALHHHRPRSRFGRFLHQLHMRHHFEDEHRGFGVSAPWWDLAFGTRVRRAGSAPSDPDRSIPHEQVSPVAAGGAAADEPHPRADPDRERRRRSRPAGADTRRAAPRGAPGGHGRHRGRAGGDRRAREGAQRRRGRGVLLPLPDRSGTSGSGCSPASARRAGPRRRC